MQKLIFEDYPSTASSLSADTMNELQDNIEEAIDLVQENLTPVVLFNASSSSGVKNDITLSDSASNYEYLEIFYHTDLGGLSFESTKIYHPNGKNVNISSIHRDGTQNVLFINSKIMNINETQITTLYIGHSYFYNESTNNISNSDYINIDRVIGYK